ncbi:hypothetical protein ACROYT_G016829 [Oculina patagonica]
MTDGEKSCAKEKCSGVENDKQDGFFSKTSSGGNTNGSTTNSGRRDSSSSDSNEEIEFEEVESFACSAEEDKSDEEGAYSQEPLADDAWMEEYN